MPNHKFTYFFYIILYVYKKRDNTKVNTMQGIKVLFWVEFSLKIVSAISDKKLSSILNYLGRSKIINHKKRFMIFRSVTTKSQELD